ncbi:MAG TPA: hypothetical protein VH253_03880 [Phycisphaerae bacterium]|nr:hypothetical protein [Phycisphaerae bacterium]
MRYGQTWAIVTCAAALAAAAPAWGQIQVQQNGSALDANPQVGSGGSNTPVQGYVPINGNNIINGNVNGLSYFHAPAGTTSPYTFQGTLGTSTLQNFERQSAGGIPTAPQSASSVYYLPSATVSTAQGSFYSAPNANGFNSRLMPSAAISPLASGPATPAPVAAGLPIRAYDVAAAAQPNPSAPTELTSPLYGIRPPLQVVAPGEGSKPGMPIVPGNAAGSKGTENQENQETPSNLPELQSNLPGAPGQGGEGGALAQGGGGLPGRGNARTGVRGQENNGGMQTTGVYSQLMEEIAQARRGGLANPPGVDNEGNISPGGAVARGNNNGQPGQPGVAPGSNGGANPEGVTPGLPGSVQANGVAGGVGVPQYQAVDPTKPNYRPNILSNESSSEGTGQGGAQALAHASPETLRAGGKVRPLPSLAASGVGAKPTPFDDLMKQAESQLKEGDYLSAADTYQMAVRSEPNNPLAILGRGNAELAAGMYESASSDLEFVFEKKPELISVKYALGDYIPVKRQAQLVSDLAKLGQAQSTGNMGSFLLCYLCYQTNRNDELHAELDRWAARPWRDQWQTIAEKAWR